MTLRITGYRRGFLKVHHTKYLKDVLGLGLKAAKTITDDVLDGKVREVEVPDDQARQHAEALRILGAVVEVVEHAQAA